MKDFEVKLSIEAESEEQIERMLDRMPHADRIYDCKIIDPDDPHYIVRIRYDENWNGEGEHFIFEGKWSNEDNWGFVSAFQLMNNMIHYTALTKIRELKNLGIEFYFKK